MRRSKVSFDTVTSGKVHRDGGQMPAASLVRRCWHLIALQTTCSVFGARDLQTMAPMGPNARAQVPAVSLASQKPEANRYGRVARAAVVVLSI